METVTSLRVICYITNLVMEDDRAKRKMSVFLSCRHFDSEPGWLDLALVCRQLEADVEVTALGHLEDVDTVGSFIQLQLGTCDRHG